MSSSPIRRHVTTGVSSLSRSGRSGLRWSIFKLTQKLGTVSYSDGRTHFPLWLDPSLFPCHIRRIELLRYPSRTPSAASSAHRISRPTESFSQATHHAVSRRFRISCPSIFNNAIGFSRIFERIDCTDTLGMVETPRSSALAYPTPCSKLHVLAESLHAGVRASQSSLSVHAQCRSWSSWYSYLLSSVCFVPGLETKDWVLPLPGYCFGHVWYLSDDRW